MDSRVIVERGDLYTVGVAPDNESSAELGSCSVLPTPNARRVRICGFSEAAAPRGNRMCYSGRDEACDQDYLTHPSSNNG
jgi:hypothetical protein